MTCESPIPLNFLGSVIQGPPGEIRNNDVTLGYDTEERAIEVAKTLPNGQKVQAPDAEGILFTYIVKDGLLTEKTEVDLLYKHPKTYAIPRFLKDAARDKWVIGEFGKRKAGGDWTDAFLKVASEADEGTSVFLKDDTYILGDNVTFSRNGLKFDAYGPSHSIVKRAPGLAADVGSFIFRACKDIQLSNFKLDGDIANQPNVCSGLVLASAAGGVEGVDLENMLLSNWGQSSMTNFSAGLAAYGAKRLRVNKSYATGNAHYGFNFYECVDVIALGNWSLDNGSHGFGAAGMCDFNFVGNHAKNNRIQGFWFRNVEDGSLTGCSATWTSPSSQFVRRGLQLKGTGTAQEGAGNNRVRNITVTGFVCRNALDTLTEVSESSGIYIQVDTGGSLAYVNINGGAIEECGYGGLFLNGEHVYLNGVMIANARNIGLRDDGVNHFGYKNMDIIDGRKQGISSRGRYGKISGNTIASKQLDTTNTYGAIEYADRSDVTIQDNIANSIEGSNGFKSCVDLKGAFATRIKVHDNQIKSTNAAVTKSADYRTSGSGNADWDNYNSTGLSPMADQRFAKTLYIGDHTTGTPSVSAGTGSPEGQVVAVPSSIYMRRDGAGTAYRYEKQSGTGNTGWVAKP